MTKNEAIELILGLARKEIGYREGANNYTKYAAELEKFDLFWGGSKNYLPWCATWVVYLFYKAFGLETGTKMLCIPSLPCGAAGCLYAAQYYKNAGRWVSQPQPGDQIFFSYAAGEYSHTGIVESVANGMVNTIEGNTSDQVARRSYPLASGSIVGYGRPKWELASGLKASDVAGVTAEIEQAKQKNPTAFVQTEILRKGAKGEAVRELQEKLKLLGYDIGKYGADGDFGRDTRNAVIRFQRDHKIQADGEVGDETRGALDKALRQAGFGVAAGTTVRQAAGIPTTTGSATASNAAALGAAGAKAAEVIVAPLEEEEQEDDGHPFHVGDIVNFIGNGCYPLANSRTGIACRPGRVLIIAVNHATKHPYRIRPLQRFSTQGVGWVDEDALEVIRK